MVVCDMCRKPTSECVVDPHRLGMVDVEGESEGWEVDVDLCRPCRDELISSIKRTLNLPDGTPAHAPPGPEPTAG